MRRISGVTIVLVDTSGLTDRPNAANREGGQPLTSRRAHTADDAIVRSVGLDPKPARGRQAGARYRVRFTFEGESR